MDSHKQIWNLAKSRFLQGEASLWVISNKTLDILWIIGIASWIYFEFFVKGSFGFLKFIGLLIIYFSIGEIRSRLSLYQGYFDGYEKGFEDAATRNCDYWGKTHDELSDGAEIKSVLNDIKNNEDRIDQANIEMRDKQISDGFSKLLGFIIWRKIKVKSN